MFDGTNTNLNFRIAMRAAELIERDGLCKEAVMAYSNGVLVGRCWAYALTSARTELNGEAIVPDQLLQIGRKIAKERGYTGPVVYNDAPSTTAADVASLLRETARRCLVEGK